MNEVTFTFHTDPGHGWLEVFNEDLTKFGFKHADFSHYSYKSKNRDSVFLEEDCDAPKFFAALKAKGIAYKVIQHYTNDESFIRNLNSIRS